MRGLACFRVAEVLRAGPAPLTLVSLGRSPPTHVRRVHMTQRHLWLGAVALAMLAQAGFVAAYHYSTSGCFCAITTSRPAPPAFVVWIVLGGSAPLEQLLQGTEIQVGGWLATLVFAAVNAVFWAIGFFGLLNLIAFVCRVRLERTSGPKRRFRLLSLAAVRQRSIATGMLLLIIAGLGARREALPQQR
jgi:hypothetical protein